MKPEIYCSKCENYDECDYIKELLKAKKPNDLFIPVKYSDCPSYRPKKLCKRK